MDVGYTLSLSNTKYDEILNDPDFIVKKKFELWERLYN